MLFRLLVAVTGIVCSVMAATIQAPSGCSSRPCTYTITCAGGTCTTQESAEVQTAINDAQPGDTIRLEAGKVFPSPGWMLPPKNPSDAWITITTTRADSLPAEDTRITPAYAPLLPQIMATTPPFGAINTENGPLPRPAERYRLVGLMFTNKPGNAFFRGLLVIGFPGGLSQAAEVDPATDTFRTAAAHGLTNGLYLQLITNGTLPNGLDSATRYYVVNASGSTFRLSRTPSGQAIDVTDPGTGVHTFVEQGVTRPDHQARNIVVDRCYFTAAPFDNVRRAIGMHGSNITVRNSFIERAKDNSTDAQAIVSYNGTGPYTVENNFLEGSTENLMFGGAIGGVISNPPLDENGVTSADISVRFNYMGKNPARYKLEKWRPGMYVEAGKPVQPSDGRRATYLATASGYTSDVEPQWPQVLSEQVLDGEVGWKPWAVDRVFRWIVKNNFELKAADRAVIQYNVFENMWLEGQETALNFKTENQTRPNGSQYAARTENILFRDNIIRSAPAAWKGSQGAGGRAGNWTVANNLFTDIDSKTYGSGNERLLQMTGIPFMGPVWFEHNTLVSPSTTAALILDRAGIPDQPVYFRNNILQRGREGVKGSGRTEGVQTIEFYLCGGKPCEDGAVSGNVIAGADLRVYPQGTRNLCPTERSCDPDYSGMNFADPAKENYSLADASPLKHAAASGADPGADMRTLPQIRNLRVEPTSTKAILYYDLSQPIQNIPCVLEVSTKRDLSAPVPDVNPALFDRADSDRRSGTVMDGAYHSIVIGSDARQTGLDGNAYSRALTPGTEYFYRLQCGGDTRTGKFRTTPGPATTGSVDIVVPVPAREGSVQAFVEYGQADQGAPESMNRRTDPVACEAGCSIAVPALQDAILYFRVIYITSQAETFPAALQTVAIQ